MEINESNLCVHRRLMRGPCDLDTKLLKPRNATIELIMIEATPFAAPVATTLKASI